MTPEFRAGERDVPSREEREALRFQRAIEKALAITVRGNTPLDGLVFDLFLDGFSVSEAVEEVRANLADGSVTA